MRQTQVEKMLREHERRINMIEAYITAQEKPIKNITPDFIPATVEPTISTWNEEPEINGKIAKKVERITRKKAKKK